MTNNANTIVLGVTKGTAKEVDNYPGTIAAGLHVLLTTANEITTSRDDGGGPYLGVSLGNSASDIPYTSVVYRGKGIPVRLKEGFTPTIAQAASSDNTTGEFCAPDVEGTTQTKAIYSGLLPDGAIAEDGTVVPAALIDFPGGL